MSGAPTSEERPKIPLLTRSQQVLLAVIVALMLSMSVGRMVWYAVFGEPLVEIVRLPEKQFDLKIDINRAGWVEWMQLPEIGEKLGKAIVLDREEHGRFTSIEDVQRVNGIGARTLEKLRPYLMMTEEDESREDAMPSM